MLALSLATACGQTLSNADRSAIRTVSIDRNVAVVAEPFYQGVAQQWLGSMLGPVGAIAGEMKAAEPKAVLKAALAKNGIDLGLIAADEFSRQAVASGVFGSLVPSGGESEIRLEVSYWGLALSGPFSVTMKPVFGITGQLVKPDGTVAWKKYYFIANMNGETPSDTFEELVESPEKLRNAFSTACAIVVRGLIADLRA